MGKWKLDVPAKMIAVPIDPEIFKEHVAEVARILYKCFCQLDPRFEAVPFPIIPHSRTGYVNNWRHSDE